MIETERLVLRAPEAGDLDALAALHADPRVMDWLSAPIGREGVAAMIDRIRTHIGLTGWGFWAAERKADRAVVGLIGLLPMGAELPPGPGVEIGWRLAHEAWGHGYAAEGATASLAWGLANLDVTEILAITARSNLRSQAVMRRIGMVPDPARDFDHPGLPAGHPLRPHVLFSAALRHVAAPGGLR
ncbi:MAG: GNAT family N-acetyltransferase [Phenylobacterium sp.]